MTPLAYGVNGNPSVDPLRIQPQELDRSLGMHCASLQIPPQDLNRELNARLYRPDLTSHDARGMDCTQLLMGWHARKTNGWHGWHARTTWLTTYGMHATIIWHGLHANIR